MVKLTVRDRESIQEAVRRFRKLVERSGIKKEMRRRESGCIQFYHLFFEIDGPVWDLLGSCGAQPRAGDSWEHNALGSAIRFLVAVGSPEAYLVLVGKAPFFWRFSGSLSSRGEKKAGWTWDLRYCSLKA